MQRYGTAAPRIGKVAPGRRTGGGIIGRAMGAPKREEKRQPPAKARRY